MHFHPLNIDRRKWHKELYKISQYPLKRENERIIKYTMMDKRQHGMSKYIRCENEWHCINIKILSSSPCTNFPLFFATPLHFAMPQKILLHFDCNVCGIDKENYVCMVDRKKKA